jgi:16S rRNA (uracil1498-N3)-methyltransferase
VARLYVPPEQLNGETLELRGDGHRYLTRVLRLRAGDAVALFDGVDNEIAARIVETGSHATRLTLGPRRRLTRPPAEITLMQGIPRGERMDLVVQKTTELGVRRIVPVISARTVAPPGAEGRTRRWRTIIQEAARQCGRADLPVLEAPLPFADALAASSAEVAARFIVWEGAQGAPLRRALREGDPRIILLVGPEGGFSEAEAAAARTAGFQAVGLGPLILRTETAAIVAVALAQAATGGLDS